MNIENIADGHIEKQEKALHYTMSIAGGIFANYSLLEYCNVFGSAETSNMILLVKDFLYWDSFHILIRIMSLIVYAAGITITLWLSKKHPSIQKLMCIAIDCLAALILGFLPLNMNPIIALYPMGFAMSIQWCTFRGVGGKPSATTFSTGNFRQLVNNLYGLFAERKRENLSSIRFYIVTMLSFHAGIAVIYLIWPYISHYSIWSVYVPLVIAAMQEYCILKIKKANFNKLNQCSVSSKENIDV